MTLSELARSGNYAAVAAELGRIPESAEKRAMIVALFGLVFACGGHDAIADAVEAQHALAKRH